MKKENNVSDGITILYSTIKQQELLIDYITQLTGMKYIFCRDIILSSIYHSTIKDNLQWLNGYYIYNYHKELLPLKWKTYIELGVDFIKENKLIKNEKKK